MEDGPRRRGRSSMFRPRRERKLKQPTQQNSTTPWEHTLTIHTTVTEQIRLKKPHLRLVTAECGTDMTVSCTLTFMTVLEEERGCRQPSTFISRHAKKACQQLHKFPTETRGDNNHAAHHSSTMPVFVVTKSCYSNDSCCCNQNTMGRVPCAARRNQTRKVKSLP